MLRPLLFSLLFFSLLMPSAYAVDDPMTVKLLSEQIIVAKKTLADIKEQVSEIKQVNDGIFEVRDTIDAVYGEYVTLKNLNIKDELQYLEDQYSGLTRLNELGDAGSLQEKYGILHSEVDRRFKESSKGEGEAADLLQMRAHEALIDLNWVEEEIAYYQRTTKALSESQLSDKDLQKFIAQSQATTTRLLLEKKKQDLNALRAQHTALESDLLWNDDFLSYLEDPRGQNGAVQGNPFTRFIVNAMNPQFIYEGMALLSGIPTMFLWLVVLFGAVRLYQEGSGSITGRASIGEAVQSMGAMVTGYMVYFSSGFLIFSVMFAYFTLFERVGSVEYIHGNLLELRSVLNTGTDPSKGWVTKALEAVADTPNVINFSWTWVVYQALSLVYVTSLQTINLLFALGVAFFWAFGFITIPTGALKDKFNLVNVWAISIFGLFMWGLIDIILMALVAGLSYSSSVWLEANHAGFGAGFTGVMIWHVYAIIMMVLVVTVKLLAIWLAFQVTSSQSMVGSFAGAATAITMMMASKTIPNAPNKSPGAAGEGSNGLFSSFMPDASGERTRDGVARATETVGGALNANISDVGRAGSRAVGGLLNSIGDLFVPAGDASVAAPDANQGSSSEHSATPSVANETPNSQAGQAEPIPAGDTPVSPSVETPSTTSSAAADTVPAEYDDYAQMSNNDDSRHE